MTNRKNNDMILTLIMKDTVLECITIVMEKIEDQD